jgi:hypothetical protein
MKQVVPHNNAHECEEQQIYYNLLTNIEKQRNNENDNYIYITGASRGLKHKSE